MSNNTGRRWAVVALSVWTALGIGLAVVSYLFPWSHTVYDIYVRACRRWWAGADMYQALGTDFYRYSPLFAVSITPWALLPDSWGNALWRVSSVLIYAAGLWAYTRRVWPVTCTVGQLSAVYLLVLPLSLHSMHIGQANVLMLGAVLFGLAAAAAERWNQAAGWLALATLIKGYPLALALLVGAVYPRRFLGRFAAALTLGLALPFACQWPDLVLAQYTSWFAHLRDSTSIMRERLRTLEHLFWIYDHPVSPQAFLMGQLLAGLVILCLCLLRARGQAPFRPRPEKPQSLLTRPKRCLIPSRYMLHWIFQLFAAWAMLFGPATESSTYIVIAPAIACAIVEAFGARTSRATRSLLVVSFLMMGPLVTDLVPTTIRNFANEHGSQPLGACLFLLMLIWRGEWRVASGGYKAPLTIYHSPLQG